MIERLLAAQKLLAEGSPAAVEAAERLFRSVAEADPRNAISVVGLARVAMARGDTAEARAHAARALAIDPEEHAARRLLGEIDLPVPAASGLASAGRGGWLRRLLNRLLGRARPVS